MAKASRRIDPAAVMLGCSTVKRSYETAYTTAQLSDNREYQKVCRQLSEMKARYPLIAVTLFQKH